MRILSAALHADSIFDSQRDTHLERLYGHCDVFIPHMSVASSVALLSMRHLGRLGHLAVHTAVAATTYSKCKQSAVYTYVHMLYTS